MERREFIGKWGRILLLGGMVAGTTYLAANGRLVKSGSCKTASQCSGCSKIKGCEKDQAIAFKQNDYGIR